MRRLNLNNIHRDRLDVFDPSFGREKMWVNPSRQSHGGRYVYPYFEKDNDDCVFSYRRPPPWITSYDDETGSSLICALCQLPEEDQWINWQKCWCQPRPGPGVKADLDIGIFWDGMHLEVVRNTNADCPENDQYHDHEPMTAYGHGSSWWSRESQRLRMQSKAIYRDPDLGPSATPIHFWWFFICQKCRKETKDTQDQGWHELLSGDPKRSAYYWDFGKHEIKYCCTNGRYSRPTLCEISSRTMPQYEKRMNYHLGAGDYWSPPTSPRSRSSGANHEREPAPETTRAQMSAHESWHDLIKEMRHDFQRDKNLAVSGDDSPPVGWGSISWIPRR